MKNALVLTVATLILACVASAAVNPTPAPAAVNVSQSSLPISTCNQERICNSDQAMLSPGEGSPMPLCPPGHNCNGQLREMAGEGSPMPLCRPGQNCAAQWRLPAEQVTAAIPRQQLS